MANPDVTVRTWNLAEIMQMLQENRQRLYDMGVRKLGLFGSYVRGEQRPDSDLDFVVELKSYSFDDYMDTKVFLEDLFSLEVDLVPEANIKTRLRPYIMKDVVYVQGFESLS